MSHVFRSPPGLAPDHGDPSEPSSVSRTCDAVLQPSRAGCKAPSSALSGKATAAEERLIRGKVLLPSPTQPLPCCSPLQKSLLYMHSESVYMHSERERKKNPNPTYIFKHCLMVKKNIWRTALPLTQSPPSPHLDTKPSRKLVQKGPLSSVMGMTLPAGAISLGTVATDRGTGGTQEPWRSGWLGKAILTVGRFLESEGKRAAQQPGDPLLVPMPPTLAHLPQVPSKWGCRRNPASFEPVSSEALPANINTLCFISQHGPGQKATSGPNKKAALPHKETQEQPLLFGFQPLLLGFSFTSGRRRQLQLRGCCWSEGEQDAPAAHGN